MVERIFLFIMWSWLGLSCGLVGCRDRLSAPIRPATGAGGPEKDTAFCQQQPADAAASQIPVLPASQRLPDAGSAALRMPVESTARATIATAPPSSIDGVYHLVATPSGALAVWAVNWEDERVSEIVGWPLDAAGRPTGNPRVLRRTTGPIKDLYASVHAGRSWLGWVTVRGLRNSPDGKGSSAEFIVAVMRVSPDLLLAEPPVTVDDYRTAGNPEAAFIEMVGTEEGGVVLLSSAPLGTCRHQDDPSFPVESGACDGYTETYVDPAGKLAKQHRSYGLALKKPYGLTRYPGGFLYVDEREHIGASHTIVSFAEVYPDQGPSAMLTSAYVIAKLHLAWNGEALVTVVEGREGPRIRVVSAQGKLLTNSEKDELAVPPKYPKLLSRTLRCVGSRLTIELKWRGGRVVIDPSHPGTHARLEEFLGFNSEYYDPPVSYEPAVWAGQALVSIRQGKLVRQRCAGVGNGSLVSE